MTNYFNSHVNQIDQSAELRDLFNCFALNPQGFLIFSGKNGRGKSYAANAIYQDFNATHPMTTQEFDDAIFITQTQLNMQWQTAIEKYGSCLYNIRQMTYPKLLIIDDLGTRTPTDAFMDFLYAIVDMRYSERDQKGTIITTNLISSDMRLRFGDAFFSRATSGKIFRFEGPDRRRNVEF